MCILFTMVFQSCEKSELEETNTELAKIENVKSLQGEKQKIAFRLLSYENKAKLWQNQMDEILENENLNDVQEKLIVELKQYITADLYNKGKIHLHEDEMEYLKIKMKREFGFNKAKTFFTEVNYRKQSPSFTDEPPCGCSIQDDWCAWWNTCSISTNCNSSEGLDCGWLWEEQCNGDCV